MAPQHEQQDRQAYDLALLPRCHQLPIARHQKVMALASEALEEQTMRQAHGAKLMRDAQEVSKRIASKSVGTRRASVDESASRAASVRRAVAGAKSPRRCSWSSQPCANLMDPLWFPDAKNSFKATSCTNVQGALPWKPRNSAFDAALEPEETGSWYYLVVETDNLRSYSCSGDARQEIANAVQLEIGQVVTVCRRQKQGWVHWLAVEDSVNRSPSCTWCCDISPEQDRTVRMMEVQIETGSWSYEAISEQSAILPRPMLRNSTRSSANRPLHSLGQSEVILVTERIVPMDDDGAILKLGDGRGWVLEYVNGIRFLQATSRLAPDTVERGDWTYIVVDPKGICPRSEPTHDKAAKLKRCIEEGEVVRVTERKIVDGTMFLKTGSPAGWVFEVQPGDQSRIRMRMVSVEQGMWSYQVRAEKGIALRMRCSFSDAAKAGHGPSKGEIVRVKERLQCGETTFLRLADGTGWVFDKKNGRQMLDLIGPKDVHEPSKASLVMPVLESGAVSAPSQDASVADSKAESSGWHYIVLDPKGIRPRTEAAYDKGIKLKHRIEEGEVVHVVERKPGEGTLFLKLSSPSGWVFDAQPNNLAKVRMGEVKVERGRWLYMVVAEKGVALRTRCSFSDAAKVATRGPDKGSILEVKERVRCGETSFLRLVDGSGWVFDVKNGKKVLDQLGPREAMEMSGTGRVVHVVQSSPETPLKKATSGFSLNFSQLTSRQSTSTQSMSFASRDGTDHANGVYLRSAPTTEKWSLTKMLLLPDQHVRISLRLKLEGGAEWFKVSKLGGMEGWVPAEYVVVEASEPYHEWAGELHAQKDGTRCVVKSSICVGHNQSMGFQVSSIQDANPQAC
eukprot:gnl/MRDRNA2_/MRDRNA2_100322_c0_seq1.p1 gnl/MRDRNA2_/MRDRNA2_100322_c0~~gnl/MRDRNA2_/MRDRNA2_100322_c0_seq1.p1  ORF type:complete len:849 (+),score=160.07 gnl/MRDRNA2_/MRDRNA2_100322_c0_seq1:98-2644(+)